jgi:hypothetical protein
MPLTQEDVDRIAALGFVPGDFLVRRDGWLQLRNTAEGRCFFLSNGQCSIYPDRPEGCRSYPVVFDEGGKNALLDPECEHHHGFTISARKASRVGALARRLRRERMERMSPVAKRQDEQ